jgi:hypothetical protein
MPKKLAAEVVAQSLDDQLAKARLDLVAAREAAERIASEEAESLGSDERFTAWLRKKRVAEQDQQRLTALVADLEKQIEAAADAAKLAAFAARWEAAAERNREVARSMQTELPKAWAIIATVLEAAAVAAIETEEVLREQPINFTAPNLLVDPEAFRRRSSFDEEVIEVQEVDLFVCKKTGSLFADQSKQKPHSITKKFKQVRYLPAQRSDSTKPFWSELRFPRLDDGGPALFDGSELRSPYDVLRALRTDRPERRQRQPQVRIEPIAPKLAQANQFDGPPAIG